MLIVWPALHAVVAALVVSWDCLPSNSKAYDWIPTHVTERIDRNATFTQVACAWLSETWHPTGLPRTPSVALTWVNGINYTNAEMEEQADFLSILFGCRVRPYYNPSLGWWLRDLTRASFMYIRSPQEDPVVTGLAQHLHLVLEEVGPQGRVIHLAHSGGALLTYLVAKYHLKEDERRRVDVINFGGARSITQKYFGRATNYYARNDPVLLVNRRAARLMQQVMNKSDGEVMYLKHNTTFVFLKGRAGDGLLDHSFIGPTYLTALHREAAVFRRHYYRAYWFNALTIARPQHMSWTRYMRKRIAAATGLHNYFSNSTMSRCSHSIRAYWKSANYTPLWTSLSRPFSITPNTSVSSLARSVGSSMKGFSAYNLTHWTYTYLSNLTRPDHNATSLNVTQGFRRVRKRSAALTGLHGLFSRSNNTVETSVRKLKGNCRTDRQALLAELPASAFLELEDDDEMDLLEDSERVFMNTSRYFTP